MGVRPAFLFLLTAGMVPCAAPAQPDALLNKIWDGVQQAQAHVKTGCGNLTETRSSRLLARPMILRGKFCAEGDSRFALDYLPPNDLHIRFADGYLNVTGGDGNTQVVEIGSAVRRAQSAFSRESSIANLKKNFAITVEEHPGGYELKFVPRSETFRRRLNYLVVTLDKQQFLPRRIEVDGKSGINSVFTIEMTAVNTTLPPKTFEVYRPK